MAGDVAEERHLTHGVVAAASRVAKEGEKTDGVVVAAFGVLIKRLRADSHIGVALDIV